MLVPREEVDVGEGVREEEGGEVLQLLCNCASEEITNMTDTQLTVLCEDNVTCTALPDQPGATIVSPILLSLTGVAGQIWALYYLYTSTRPQHSRTVFFVLLSTLIWTDLVGKIITTGPALAAYVQGRWVGGVSMCNFHGFSMMLISLVTHLLVSTMAVERFIGIRHGYFYNKNITTSRTKLLLLGIWLFSVLFCAMPLFGVGQYGMQYPGSWCFVNIHVTSSSPFLYRLYTNVFGVFTIVNLLIMVVCNIVVIIVLLEKTISRRGNLCEATLLCLRLCRHRCSGTSFCAPQRTYRQRELEMQMVIVLLVITIVFIISWTPIDMRLFLNQVWPHRTRKDHLQDLIAVRLTSINQIVDPWAYIICRKMFATRAWRWMRQSLMGSKLLGREGSAHNPAGGGGGGGSHKKLSKTVKPPDKIQYKTPFRGGGGDGTMDVNKGQVAVVDGGGGGRGDAILSLPPPPLSPNKKTTATTNGDLKPKTTAAVNEVALEVGGDELEAKQHCVEIFRDSATSTDNTPPSNACSDSGHANYCTPLQSGQDVATLAVVPIPVFTCEQYRVRQLMGDHHHHSRLKRISSSASARASSASRRPKHTLDPNDTNSDSWVSASSVLGRRHSWCCTQDAPDVKQYCTKSTQTFKPNHHTDDHHDPCHLGDDLASCHQRDDDVPSRHNHQLPNTPSHRDDRVSRYQETGDATYYQHVDDICHPVDDDVTSCRRDDYITPYNQSDRRHHNHSQYDRGDFSQPGEPLFNDLSNDNGSLYKNQKDFLNNHASLYFDKERLHNDHTSLFSGQNDLSNYYCNFNSEGHHRDLLTDSHRGYLPDSEGNTVFIIGNGMSRWRDKAEGLSNINNGALNSIYSRNGLECRDYEDMC